MGKIPKAIVEEDFSYVVNNYIHGEFAQQLLNEWKNENIRFQVTRDLEVDGETNLYKRKRRCLIKIKRDVAKSKFTCWRRAVVCHELGHALHFFETNGQIWKGQEHGKVWKNMMASAVKEGIFKTCARRLKSPPPQCILKSECNLCEPKDKKVTKYVRTN